MFHRKTDRYRLLSRSGSLLVLIASLMLADAAAGEDRLARYAPVSPAPEHYNPLTPVQLEDLVGPIALYPDELIGIILPASTNPIQVVQAVRFLDRYADNPNLTPDPEWDESIIALLNYPKVLRLMDKNLEWTVKLGYAVNSQQEQLLGAIQRFRRRANSAGNLNSDDKQRVLNQGNNIAIEPVNPEEIYIPSYDPQQVVIRHFSPVYDYYPLGYPVYYYPYAPDYQFSTGFFWGVTTAFLINWNAGYILSYRNTNLRHPYYRSNYYTNRFLYRDWRDRREGYRSGRSTVDRNRGRRRVTVTGTPTHRQTAPDRRTQDRRLPPLLRNAPSLSGLSAGHTATASTVRGRYQQRNFRSRDTRRSNNRLSGVAVQAQSSRSQTVQRSRNSYRATLPHVTVPVERRRYDYRGRRRVTVTGAPTQRNYRTHDTRRSSNSINGLAVRGRSSQSSTVQRNRNSYSATSSHSTTSRRSRTNSQSYTENDSQYSSRPAFRGYGYNRGGNNRAHRQMRR